MEAPLPLLLILLLFSSTTISDSAIDNFLKCLPQHSSPSHPISSAIYTRNNSSFTSILQSRIRNLRFNTSATPKPLAIVAALHKSHIQATVICAKLHGLQIRIRSGGHDYEGLSYTSNIPFVVLDMFNLHSIVIDLETETAWVQSGATLGELYYRIAEKSRVHGFPGGVCPTVGTGGHFGGGGYGNLLRKYGLAVDNIIDAQLIDVNGKILDRKSMGEDLFWAIRGGGAASFGVVLSWKINLVPVPATVTVFKVDRTTEDATTTDAVYQWQHVAPELDNDLFIRLEVTVVNGSREGTKTAEVSFIGQFLGQCDRLLPLMHESLPLLRFQQSDCIEMSWIESTLFWNKTPIGTPTNVLLNTKPEAWQQIFKSKSDYVKNPISKMGLESIWKEVIQVEPVLWMQWNPYGGRMREISNSATPYPHRLNLFKIQYWMDWEDNEIAATKLHLNQATKLHLNQSRSLYRFMTSYVSNSPREAFFNYRDIDIGTNLEGKSDFGIKYFKSNMDRLVKVKTMVDPDNFFRNEQSIPTLHSWKK